MKSFTTAAIAALAASVSATSPPAYAVSQIADGQIQAPTGNPVTQIADGQIQAPTGSPVTQIADGQIQAPTGSPVTQIADGQIQAPTGAPVQQIGDGQIQQPKASGVQQIADGQIQQPAAGGVPTYSGSKTCQNITVPVSITARNAVFDQMKLTPKDNIDVTNFILNNARQGHNFTQESIMGYTDFSGDYNLSTTYCAPSGGAPSTVQLLTHGIGFDRSYWDFSYNNYNYSYTNEAVEKYGYATFSHDRLGIGMSSHGEPVNEIQVALEIAALKELTDKLRAGEIAGVPAFKKVIHVGHSFGSVQSYALAAMYPDITDGLGLTGFSQNGTFLPFFQYGGDFTQANLNPAFAGKYVDGYLAPASASAVQTNFFAQGDFDPKVLEVATMTGQPVTIGELLTIGGATGSKNPTKAPVLIITGEKDIPFCGGDCFAAPTGFQSIPETSKAMFPNTANFVVDIVPGAGHGLNLQYTHVQTYASIFGFFQSNGLAA